MSGPRVLVAHPYPDLYGADRVLLDAVLAMRSAGMVPTLVLPEPGPMTTWLADHDLPYRFVDVPVMRRAVLTPRGMSRLLTSARRDFARVAQTLKDLKPDLVYVNTVTLPHWTLGARRAQTPVIVHAHESDARTNRLMAMALVSPLLAADQVVAVSEAAAEFIAKAIPPLKRRTRVVYNGLAVPELECREPLTGSVARLVVVGRLNPNKGQDVAIKAVESLVRRGRDVHLTVAGDTFAGYEDVERELRDSVARLGLEDRVRFTGFCRDVASLLCESDIFLAPSRTDSLPLTVIEAMLAGRPVVASAVGGIPELISDESTGLLVPPGRPDALADRIDELLQNPARARLMGAAARSTAIARFSRDRFQDEIVATVRDALDRTPVR